MAIHIVDGECSVVELPPTAIDKLNSKINYTNSRITQTNNNVNSVSNRVTDITPYEMSKKAYIGDTEVVFDKVKDGMINANCITESGLSVPTTLVIEENKIIVKFNSLEEVAIATVFIQ